MKENKITNKPNILYQSSKSTVRQVGLHIYRQTTFSIFIEIISLTKVKKKI